RSQWAAWGVTGADGKPLPNDNMPASVVLPLGRFGPTFLAYDNFQAYLKWNQSLNYSLTAAYYATRLDGAPPMNRGSPNIPKNPLLSRTAATLRRSHASRPRLRPAACSAKKNITIARNMYSHGHSAGLPGR